MKRKMSRFVIGVLLVALVVSLGTFALAADQDKLQTRTQQQDRDPAQDGSCKEDTTIEVTLNEYDCGGPWKTA